jgi:hypothetical protein
MFVHVSVKKDRFEALLRFLISDAIQPFKNPLVIDRTPNFFEGAKVNSVTISASPHERQLFLGQPGPKPGLGRCADLKVSGQPTSRLASAHIHPLIHRLRQ